MKLTKLFLVLTFLVVALSVSTLASPQAHAASAHAMPPSHISHPAAAVPLISTGATGCWSGGQHPDYLGIYTDQQGWSCFSGDGYIGFRIDGNAFIHAGNNYGWVRCYGGSCGTGSSPGFNAYQEFWLGDGYITQVAITHQ